MPAVLRNARLTVSTGYTAVPYLQGTREFDATNIAEFYPGSVTPSEVALDVRGGTGTLPVQNVRVSFSLPAGERFRAGQFSNGEATYGHGPWGEVSLGSSACAQVRFTVVSAAFSGNRLTGLDVRFSAECALRTPWVVGELVLGPTPGPVLTSARVPGWHDVPLGATSPARIPLWYRNVSGSSQAVGRAALSGATADFRMISDTCTGRRLAPRAGCQIMIAFTPTVAGQRVAWLALKVGGTATRTPLTGTGTPGRTSLVMESQHGEWIGQGRQYLLTDAQYPITVDNVARDRTGAVLIVQNGANRPEYLSVVVALAGGLRTGTFRTGSEAGDLRLYVDGNASGCATSPGTATIRQVEFDASNALRRLDLSFVQRCATESPDKALTGRISYRATTAAPLPPVAPFILRNGQSVTAARPLTNLAPGPHTQRLAITSAGRAAVSFDGAIIWTSPAAGAGARLSLRTDGSLALVSRVGRVVWSTKPKGADRTAFLVLQTDGNLALNSGHHQRLWHTNSAQTIYP